MLSLALIFSDVLIGKDLLKQSLLTFFIVNRESRRNRTNEIRRNERSCRGQAWKHRVTFFEMFWPSLMSWTALTLSGVRCKLHKQSRLTFFKSQSEIHDGIGRSSRSPAWKHRVLFEVQPWHSQSSKWTDVVLGIDILWCPDRQRPSETITLDLLQSQSGIAAESYQRNQTQRKILQRSSMKAPCGFFEMPWPSLMSWSALTLSGVRCKLHKQSRLTFFKLKSEIHDGIDWPSRSSIWKHRVSFSRFSPVILRAQNGLMLSLALIFSDVLIGKDLVGGKMWPSETITLDLLHSQSGIAAESYQRNQAQRKILQRLSMRAPCDFFEMFWPSLISWSALTLSGVRCELHKQSRLTFFKSKSEIHDGIGRSSRSPAWKHRVAFSRFTLDRHRGHHSAYQLLSSTLTFTDVLIGIDLVRGKMWPSETITYWLSSKSIENRTESGGTYQRNQAFRLTTACGFFEMSWPSQMSIGTHHVILSVDVIWCLIGTDFCQRKDVPL